MLALLFPCQNTKSFTTELILPWTFPGCSVANVTDNVCGEEACTPGPVGYTCGETSAARALRSVDTLVFACRLLPVNKMYMDLL